MSCILKRGFSKVSTTNKKPLNVSDITGLLLLKNIKGFGAKKPLGAIINKLR
jgi:hypothetical protein